MTESSESIRVGDTVRLALNDDARCVYEVTVTRHDGDSVSGTYLMLWNGAYDPLQSSCGRVGAFPISLHTLVS